HLQAPYRGGDRRLHRERGVARQGRRLCDPGARRGLRPQPQRLLFQRRRPAALRDGGAPRRPGLSQRRVSGRLLIAASPGEVRGALLEEGRLVELRLERLGQGSRVGDIHLGRVLRILPALPAALADLGLGAPAFLSEEDAVDAAGPANRSAGIAAWLHEGQAVLVQVTRDAQGEKAAGISLRLRLKGRYLVLTPTRP